MRHLALPAVLTLLLSLMGLPAATAQAFIHVDASATGAGNGTSWADAFTDLSAGLAEAGAGDTVLVAEGTYSPGGADTDTFDVAGGVTVQGGHPAGGGPSTAPVEDPTVHKTVLDGGDVNDHVVTVGEAGVTLYGLTIIRGEADGDAPDGDDGAGILGTGDDLLLDRVRLLNNVAGDSGGGTHLSGAGVVLREVRWIGNTATHGGGHFAASSGQVLDGGRVLGNTALDVAFAGGGWYSSSTGHTIVNTLFSGNYAPNGVGGAHSAFGDTIVNSTFVGNRASDGAASDLFGANTLVNVIEADNGPDPFRSASNDVFRSARLSTALIDPNASNTDVQVIGTLDGFGMFDPDGLDDIYGTEDDDVRLFQSSPLVDAGTDPGAPDRADRDRDGDTDEPMPLDIDGGARLVDGLADGGVIHDIGADEAQHALFVDALGPADGLGTTWDDAFPTLQQGLAAAVPGSMVLVAQGTYSPGPDDDDTFTLNHEVFLQGGHETNGGNSVDPTTTEGSLADPAEDPARFPAILDGGGVNDHVLTIWGDGARVYGVTITGGHADGIDIHQNGAGILGSGDDLRLDAVRLVDNHAGGSGGGTYLYGDRAVMREVTWIGNTATLGGGHYARSGGQVLDGGRLLGNRATGDTRAAGGGWYSSGGGNTVVNTLYSGNDAPAGRGGAHSTFSDTIANSTFVGNTASDGAASDLDGANTLVNIVEADNGPTPFGEAVDSTFRSARVSVPLVNPDGSNTDVQVIDTLAGFGLVDPDGVDGLYGTEDDNVRLRQDSVLIDAGTETDLPGNVAMRGNPNAHLPLVLDLVGNPRFHDVQVRADLNGSVIDIGAHEAYETDLGDAPTTYGTTIAAGDASHQLVPDGGAAHLGAPPDDESDGQPNADATGDDGSGVDDEDGVTFGTVTAGSTGQATLTTSGFGFVDAWVDFDGDGTFDHPGEQIVSGLLVSGADETNVVTFAVPAGTAGSTVTRFRISRLGGLLPIGPARDGEVEDHAVTIVDPPPPPPAGGGGIGGAPAPTADAGGPYTVEVAEVLTLDASGSTAGGGGTLTYAWDLDGDGAFDDATGVAPTFSSDVAGTVQVAVRVTETVAPLTATDTDSATITVAEPATVAEDPGPFPEDDNVARSIAITRRLYPTTTFAQTGPGTVLLGTDAVFADSLASGGAQGVLDAPLLLTGADTLDRRIEEELARLGPITVILLGGTAAISDDVRAELDELGYTTSRFAGPTRLETAIEIARATNPDATQAVLVRAFPSPDSTDASQAFADSLAAGALAAELEVPLLLTQPDVLSTSLATYLAEASITEVVVVGGAAAIAPAVRQALSDAGITQVEAAGAERAATATAIAGLRGAATGADADGAILVDARHPDTWADAFPGALLSATRDAPIVLTDGDLLPPATADWLADADLPLTCLSLVSPTACALADGV